MTRASAAVNVRRYAVLPDTVVTVWGGVEMVARSGLIVDGLIVLVGLLTFEG